MIRILYLAFFAMLIVSIIGLRSDSASASAKPNHARGTGYACNTDICNEPCYCVQRQNGNSGYFCTDYVTNRQVCGYTIFPTNCSDTNSVCSQTFTSSDVICPQIVDPELVYTSYIEACS
jgi:hypothetical protein